ncbi:MAG: hypothetical protein J3K34DRAFT_399689 [Monoraphidium minutum]|nr:MAG: hypothetical protein J3K34DRAFT_399689 [Monoraphidium minutum]
MPSAVAGLLRTVSVRGGVGPGCAARIKQWRHGRLREWGGLRVWSSLGGSRGIPHGDMPGSGLWPAAQRARTRRHRAARARRGRPQRRRPPARGGGDLGGRGCAGRGIGLAAAPACSLWVSGGQGQPAPAGIPAALYQAVPDARREIAVSGCEISRPTDHGGSV